MKHIITVILVLSVLGCSLIPLSAISSTWPEIKFKSENGNIKAEVNGAIMGDYVDYKNAPEKFEEGSELTSLQLSMKLELMKTVKVKVKYDYSDDNPELKDASIGFKISNYAELTIGQFEQPSSLEGVTSSKDITFLTRAAPVESFLSGRSQGINLGVYGDYAAVQLGSYIEYDMDNKGHHPEKYINYSARSYIFPLNKKRNVLHLGLWGIYAEPFRNRYELEVESESKVNAKDILESGKIKHVDRMHTGGIEFGWIHGPVTAQAEYIHQDYSRFSGYDEFYYNGYYCSLSFMLTGESKLYSSKGGAIESPKPKGGYGAFEVAIRSSNVDMTHPNRDRGEMDSHTVGINWYLSEGFRMMYNYTQTESTELNEPMEYSQVRLQYAF